MLCDLAPSAWRAAPKSISTGLPPGRMTMFAGLIAVEEAGLVHLGHAGQKRVEEFQDLGFGERARLLQDLAEADTVLVGHYEIGGAVRFEVAVDGDDVGMTEADERARLVAETLQ